MNTIFTLLITIMTNPIPSIEKGQKTFLAFSWTTAVNTIACGIAVRVFFGPVVALTCMVANIAFSWLNNFHEERPWFPLDQRAVEDVKEYWKESQWLFTISAISGLLFRLLELPPSNQVALVWLRNSLISPLAAIYAVFRICVIAPIIEETIFRGFLQEKIRDIQVYIWGEKADNKVHQETRVVLQAIPFGALHYHVSHGLFNVVIILVTGVWGYLMGVQKEKAKDSHLWRSIAMHSHLNTAVTTRTILFKA